VKYLLVFLVGCGLPPVFNASADHEEGADIPCYQHGEYVNGYHACRRDPGACCPDGYSCGADDFVPRQSVCRWWGKTGAITQP
jgi:hypothetical protein